MAVEEKELGEEEKAQEQTRESALKDSLLKSLDLEADIPPEEKPEEGKEKEVEGKEDEDKDPDGEKEESEEKAEGEDEVIPRSKHEKIVEKQERRINQLTARLNQLEGKVAREEPEAKKDSDTDRLEKMTTDQLKTLKRNVRVAQAREVEDEKLNELVDLELKIDEAITNAPQRFVSKQVALYNDAAQEIIDSEDIPDIDKAAPEIRAIAVDIYGRYPKLQRIEEGQAMALRMAAEHYKAINKLSSGKEADREKSQELKQKLNTLKRKTGLDGTGVKGTSKAEDISKLREKAGRGAEHKDKLALVMEDPAFAIESLIPKEYL
jgi:hypothetical protein